MSGYNAYQYTNQYPYNYLSTSPAYLYNQPQVQVPTQQVQMPQQVQQPQQNSINWVQGEAGAKSFNVEAGRSVMLMDSESSVFYIKSTDASGMPLPLRIFDYTERTQAVNPVSNPIEDTHNQYVTKEEFETAINNINQIIQNNITNIPNNSTVNTSNNNRKRGSKNESTVQSFKQ